MTMRTILLLCVLLAGCATVGETALKAGTTGSVRFEAEDVDAAIRIAQDAKDTVAESCFKAIRGHLDQPAKPDIKGVVSAYALARATVRNAQAGLASDVHVACSPLVVDAAQFQVRLGKVFAEGLSLGAFQLPPPPINLPTVPR